MFFQLTRRSLEPRHAHIDPDSRENRKWNCPALSVRLTAVLHNLCRGNCIPAVSFSTLVRSDAQPTLPRTGGTFDGPPVFDWGIIVEGDCHGGTAAGFARTKWAICLWVVSVPVHARASSSNATGTPHRGTGVTAMSEAHNQSLLIEYFKAFINDRDLDLFRSRVSARYNEGTLGRIISASNDVTARRAAVLSLEIVGSFEHSNTVLGRALSDDDPVVRTMAEDSLWAIWFRADTSEHNQILRDVALAISRDQLEQAEVL